MTYKKNGEILARLLNIFFIVMSFLLLVSISVYADGEIQYAYQYSYAPLEDYQSRLYNISTYGTNPATGFVNQIGVYYGFIKHINVGVFGAIPITQTGIGSQIGAELSYYTHTNIINISSFLGYVSNSSGPSYVNVRLVMSRDINRINITINTNGTHTYRSGSDPVDLTFDAGTTYLINRFIKIGLETLGEDLESAFEPDESEGGSTFIVSPIVVLNSGKSEELNLIVGPGYQIKNGISGAVLRVIVAKTF